jgi:hypothetical protein
MGKRSRTISERRSMDAFSKKQIFNSSETQQAPSMSYMPADGVLYPWKYKSLEGILLLLSIASAIFFVSIKKMKNNLLMITDIPSSSHTE